MLFIGNIGVIDSMSSLEFKWLDDFISLKELGNFSVAATARHVTQSAFSRRIQALELWVGVPLFDRTSYPIKLTDDGEKFVPYVEKMLQLIRETNNDFSQASLRTDNSVRVVCLHSFALNLIPELFSSAGKMIEGLNFSLTPSIQGIDNHFQALLDNACDIIFVYDTQGMRPSYLLEDKVERMLVSTTRIIPVMSPDLRKSIPCHQSLPYLAYSKQTFLYGVVNSVVGENRLRFEQVFETTLSESLIKMAVNDAGIAWVPTHAIKEEMEKGILIPAFPEKKQLEIPLDIVCYRSRESKREALNHFWSIIKKLTQQSKQ